MSDEVAGDRLVLRAGNLVREFGAPAEHDRLVVIAGGRVQAIEPAGAPEPAGGRPFTPSAPEVDLGGAWVVPGLLDAHLHFMGIDPAEGPSSVRRPLVERMAQAVGDARRVLESGFTTVRCLGSPLGPALGSVVDRGVVPGPRIVAAGEFVCATAGTWDPVAEVEQDPQAVGMRADGVDACRAIVRRRVRQGARVVKIGCSRGQHGDSLRAWGDDPAATQLSYSPEEIAAVCDEARRQGIPVAAHAIGDEAVQAAATAGVHTIEHGHGISQETRALLAELGTIVVPTLTVMALRAATGVTSMPSGELAAAKRQLATQRRDVALLRSAGVTVAAGTDLWGPRFAPHGSSLKELELLVECGFGVEEALVAATTQAARAVGMAGEVGTLRPGAYADLLVLRDDPRTSLQAFTRIAAVVKGGQVVNGTMEALQP